MINCNSMTPVQIAVYLKLCNLEVYTTPDLLPICDKKIPRDIIKQLRRKGFLIHGEGKWHLDARHISSDEKAGIIATAESKAKYRSKSLKLAKSEAKRIPMAVERKLKTDAELAMLRNSPNIKNN